MPGSAPRRAVLSVPASSEPMLAKAASRGADEVVIDLEDSVAPARKEDALAACLQALDRWRHDPPVAIRVNAPGTPWCHREIVAVAERTERPLTIVLPKVESAADLHFAERLLEGAEAPGRDLIGLQALIETAAGLARVEQIAAASPRLRTLVLGYADLGASLAGRHQPDEWLPAQHSVLLAARAHGLEAIDGPELELGTESIARVAAERARRLGFDGKWAIHPRQIATLLAAFTPTEEEIAAAAATIDALDQAHAAGDGAGAFAGAMVDEATTRSARRILARAGNDGG